MMRDGFALEKLKPSLQETTYATMSAYVTSRHNRMTYGSRPFLNVVRFFSVSTIIFHACETLWMLLDIEYSGTTWTQEMVYCIATDLDFEAAKIGLQKRFPYLEYEKVLKISSHESSAIKL